jgi:hypothetical protein
MKVAITGHTQNLGKVLYTLLKKENEVIGFSRTNNYPLENYEKIIQDANECDVFINNTYHPIYQQKIFEGLFEEWKYKEKTIFNILTSAILNNGIIDEYRESKLNLQKSSINLMNKHRNMKLRVVNLYPTTLEHNEIVTSNKIKFSEIFDIIKFQLLFPSHLKLTHISILSTTISSNARYGSTISSNKTLI